MSDKSLFDVIGDIFDLLFMWSTTSEIANLNKEVEQLKEAARKDPDPVHAELASLRAANAELRLHVATLCRALILKGIISREDLAKLVATTDAEDGKSDNAHAGNILP